MKTYELDAEQSALLEKAFLMMPPQDGTQQKIEAATNRIQQTAKYLMTITKKSPEQTLMLRKLQEVNLWVKETITKYEY